MPRYSLADQNAAAVLVLRGKKTAEQLAQELGVSVRTVNSWVRNYSRATVTRSATAEPEREITPKRTQKETARPPSPPPDDGKTQPAGDKKSEDWWP